MLLALAEHVTYRLRKYNLLANVVNVQLRTSNFEDFSHQSKFDTSTSNTKTIYKKAKSLLNEMYKDNNSIRLIGLRVDSLVSQDEVQMSFFSQENDEKQNKIDKTLDELKNKYGYNFVTRAGKLGVEDIIKIKKKVNIVK